MKKSLIIPALAILLGLVVASCNPTMTVDEKSIEKVPGTNVRCYLLEVDNESSSNEDLDGNTCVPEALWDANEPGEHLVDVNGQRMYRVP